MIRLKDILEKVGQFKTEYDFLEMVQEKTRESIEEFMHNPNGRQEWDVVPYSKIKKTWESFMKYGFVRNEKDVEDILTQLLISIAKLWVNTYLSGHTPHDPRGEWEDLGFTKEDEEKYNDSEFITDESGNWRISDYASDKLFKLANEAIKEKDVNKKLIIADQILNVAHMRSDLSRWFVQGGKQSLDDLAGYEKAITELRLKYSTRRIK